MGKVSVGKVWFFMWLFTLLPYHSAEAYVRTTTKPDQQGFPLFWKSFPVPFHITDKDFPPELDRAGVLSALQGAFTAWTQPDCTCATFAFKGLTNDTALGYNQDNLDANKNLVVFQKDSWSHAELAVAVASVIFDRDNGELVAFDIEINSKKFTFTLDGKGPGLGVSSIDLANTMTHEAGHTLGIDHSPVSTASMFSTAPPGEISKRTLDPDDQKAVCDIYPVPADGVCASSGGQGNGGLPTAAGCGCQQTQTRSLPLFLFFFGWFLFAFQRSRR